MNRTKEIDIRKEMNRKAEEMNKEIEKTEERDTIEEFINICYNLHNMTKKERIEGALNSDLFALAMVYMKYDKTCLVSSLPYYFEDTELYYVEFINYRCQKKYVVYSNKDDIGLANITSMAWQAKL